MTFEVILLNVSTHITRYNLGVSIDFLTVLKDLGFGQIEWACKKKSTIVRTK